MTMLLLLEDHRCESAIRRGQSHNLFEARIPHKILKRHIGAKPVGVVAIPNDDRGFRCGLHVFLRNSVEAIRESVKIFRKEKPVVIYKSGCLPQTPLLVLIPFGYSGHSLALR